MLCEKLKICFTQIYSSFRYFFYCIWNPMSLINNIFTFKAEEMLTEIRLKSKRKSEAEEWIKKLKEAINNIPNGDSHSVNTAWHTYQLIISSLLEQLEIYKHFIHINVNFFLYRLQIQHDWMNLMSSVHLYLTELIRNIHSAI